MEGSLERIRSAGLKTTVQRVLVYETLQSMGHGTCDAIFDKVKEKIPTISLATVYSVLRSFSEKGLIRELTLYNDKVVFDITPEDHYHFVCVNCGRIEDLSVGVCPYPGEVDASIERFCGVYYGLCGNCKNKEVE